MRLRPRRRKAPSSDPGLQAERTAMAWQRTALNVGGVSALLLHGATDNPVTAAPGVAGLLVAIGLLLMVERRYEQTVRRVASGSSPAGPAPVRTVAVTAVALAVAALVLLTVAPG